MEKFTHILITAILAILGLQTVNFGIDYLAQTRTFEQTFIYFNVLALVGLLFGAAAYFTADNFRKAFCINRFYSFTSWEGAMDPFFFG